jgi:hypothetical protein
LQVATIQGLTGSGLRGSKNISLPYKNEIAFGKNKTANQRYKNNPL